MDRHSGNLRTFFYQGNVGDLDFKYVNEYGLVWRMGGPLGVREIAVLECFLLVIK